MDTLLVKLWIFALDGWHFSIRVPKYGLLSITPIQEGKWPYICSKRVTPVKPSKRWWKILKTVHEWYPKRVKLLGETWLGCTWLLEMTMQSWSQKSPTMFLLQRFQHRSLQAVHAAVWQPPNSSQWVIGWLPVKKRNPFQAAILLHPHKGVREPLSSQRRAAPFDFSFQKL